MVPPTITQQRGLSFAPIPFSVTSFFACSYVIYYLLHKERNKLRRMYHRLVLAMNFAHLPVTLIYVWKTFIVPEGTTYVPGASGNVHTCTASGFLYLTSSLAVPTYYGSLSLQAFMGIKNDFKEEKYQWIEKFVHLAAWSIPCAISITVAATENFNPSGSGCFIAKAPPGCETDAEVTCERGEDIAVVEYIVGFGLIFLYFVYPPSVVIAMHLWIKKIGKRAEGCRGMQKIRENARKQIIHQIAIQTSVYLCSFWFTFVPALIDTAYTILTREILYDFLIFSDCVFALQGFVMAMVYFTLQRIGTPKPDGIPSPSPGRRGSDVMVRDIRFNASSRASSGSEVIENNATEKFAFNIFDGVPDEDSPWARYFDQDGSYSDGAEVPDAQVCVMDNNVEQT